MEKIPFHRSKTAMTLAAVLLLIAIWQFATWHLYSLPEHSVAAFQAITVFVFTSISAIAMWSLGMKGVDRMFSFKSEALSAATSTAQSITESITERMFNCEKLDPKDIDEEAQP